MKSTHPGSDQSSDIAHLFDHLLSKGNIGAALHLLTATRKGGVLPLDSLVPSGFDSSGNHCIKQLRRSSRKNIPREGLLLKILFLMQVWILPVLIQFFLIHSMPERAAFHTHDAAGPSGVDAFAWQRLCSSFGDASEGLCNSLASVAHCLATSEIDPTFLAPFVACRLISMDKNPGVHPIDIGDIPQRILAKAIL